MLLETLPFTPYEGVDLDCDLLPASRSDLAFDVELQPRNNRGLYPGL
jgi:hypothetical protein